MKIAAHILGKKTFESFLFVSLKIVARDYPYHQIIIFVEEIVGNVPDNLKQIKIETNNGISYAYWKKFSLPKLIKKEEANCFISEVVDLSANIIVPQYLFFNNDDFTQKKSSFVQSLGLAKYIFVTEEFIGDLLNEEEKTKVVYHGLPQKQTAFNNEALNFVKENYAKGYEYILFPVDKVAAKNILIVLKAYSLLKKWQKTSIKLLLLLDNMEEEKLIADFKNYKYKSDIVFVKATSDNSLSITAAAFVSLFFADHEKTNNAFIAMQNNIPIVAADTVINRSLFCKAALYTILNEVSIFETLQTLYKDESKRNEMKQQAAILLQKYSTEKAAADLFKLITE